MIILNRKAGKRRPTGRKLIDASRPSTAGPLTLKLRAWQIGARERSAQPLVSATSSSNCVRPTALGQGLRAGPDQPGTKRELSVTQTPGLKRVKVGRSKIGRPVQRRIRMSARRATPPRQPYAPCLLPHELYKYVSGLEAQSIARECVQQAPALPLVGGRGGPLVWGAPRDRSLPIKLGMAAGFDKDDPDSLATALGHGTFDRDPRPHPCAEAIAWSRTARSSRWASTMAARK